MFCSKCETLLSSNAKVCPKCHHRIIKIPTSLNPFSFISVAAYFCACLAIGYYLMSIFTLNPDVNYIKNAILMEYPDTLIGEAFDTFFLQPTWESFETDSNTTIIEFTGEYLDGQLFEPILVQFTLYSDDQGFDLTYFEQNDREQTKDQLLHLLDQIYTDVRVADLD